MRNLIGLLTGLVMPHKFIWLNEDVVSAEFDKSEFA